MWWLIESYGMRVHVQTMVWMWWLRKLFVFIFPVWFSLETGRQKLSMVLKKKKDSKFPYVRGASFDFNDFENFQSFIKWGQEVASSLD